MTFTEEDRRLHRKARDQAIRDLIEIHRAEFDMLRQMWIEHLRKEEGERIERRGGAMDDDAGSQVPRRPGGDR
jgi:hypothetical protein